MYEYEGDRRYVYGDGACFIPRCERCGRYVKRGIVRFDGLGQLVDEPNAVCSRCGPVRMIFEGFIDVEEGQEEVG